VPRVQLPPGCFGIETPSGKKYSAKPGGTIEVSQHVADRINKSTAGASGVLRGGELLALGTKRGRSCSSCRRIWQAWSTECPRCGNPTEADYESEEVDVL
jgi:hypothetical protein